MGNREAAVMAKLIPVFGFVFSAYAFCSQRKCEPDELASMPRLAHMRPEKPSDLIVVGGVISKPLHESKLQSDENPQVSAPSPEDA